MEYNDEYPTCERTYATVRILGMPANDVGGALGLIPTHTQSAVEGAPSRPNGWFLTTKDAVNSRDIRHHLNWLLDRLEPRATALADLRGRGATIDIFCYWLSASGHGGPIRLRKHNGLPLLISSAASMCTFHREELANTGMEPTAQKNAPRLMPRLLGGQENVDFRHCQKVLERAGVVFADGLFEAELRSVENRYGFRFPADLREYLAHALPTGNGFRTGVTSRIRK